MAKLKLKPQTIKKKKRTKKHLKNKSQKTAVEPETVSLEGAYTQR